MGSFERFIRFLMRFVGKNNFWSFFKIFLIFVWFFSKILKSEQFKYFLIRVKKYYFVAFLNS